MRESFFQIIPLMKRLERRLRAGKRVRCGLNGPNTKREKITAEEVIKITIKIVFHKTPSTIPCKDIPWAEMPSRFYDVGGAIDANLHRRLLNDLRP